MKLNLLNDFNKCLSIKDFDELSTKIECYSFSWPLLLFRKNFDKSLNGYIDLVDNILSVNLNEDDDSYLNLFLDKCNFSNKNIFIFILSELVDNISDHANSNNAFIIGYFKENYFDIIIIDDGITIPKSLELHGFNFKNDCEAILSAINGNSTKNEFGYFERGCGLNNSFMLMTQSENSSILVASRNGLIYSKKDNIYKRDISNNSINGTIIALRFDKNYNFKSLYEIIKNRYDVNMQVVQ